MQLQTIVPIKPLKNTVTYNAKIISIGSCFAVNMSKQFQNFQFQNTINPLGILFHPVAILRLIDFAVNNKIFDEKDVFLHNEIWSCFDAHSDLNEIEQKDLLFQLNQKTKNFKKDLIEATHCILTFGTAWVYRNKSSNQLVANCHKLPQNQFDKELLSIEDCQTTIFEIEKNIRKLNPEIQIIYTLSPVRHIKDGFVENQQSKAHLISSLQTHLNQNANCNYYFPSYEIMMDELRDYRFYAKDLIHPNELAVEYIWRKFVEYCIDTQEYPTMKMVDEVQKGLAHRPFNPYSDGYQYFLEALAEKIDLLLEKYPFMNFR